MKTLLQSAILSLRKSVLISSLLTLTLAVSFGRAATKTWNGSVNGQWNTAGNWTPSGVPASTDLHVFGLRGIQNVTNNASRTIAGVAFTNGGFSIYGSPLTISGEVTNALGVNSILAPLNFTSNPKIWDVALGTELVLASDTGTSTAVNNSPYQKYGAGTVRFKGSNYWAKGADLNNGATIIDGGSLTATNDGYRLAAQNGAWAGLLITNNGSLYVGTVAGGPNLRVGYTANLTGSNELHLSSGQIIVDKAASEVILGDKASTKAVFNQTGGTLRYQNNTKNPSGILLGSDLASVGIYNFDGGIAEVPRIRQDLGSGYLYLNGGTLKPSSAAYASSFLTGLTEARIKDGGVIIDTAGFNIVVGQALLAGGTGGLTKNGAGALTLSGANTYVGPTILNAGTLGISTLHAGGGVLTAADNTTLSVTVAGAGSSLNLSALTLGSSAGATNEFNLGATGNVVSAVVNATNLTVNGTIDVNITGAGFFIGQFPLIKYGSASGVTETAFVLGRLPSGVVAQLSNNVAESSLDLVISFVPSLIWRGETNGVPVGDWNVADTTNWFDSGTAQPTFYTDGSLLRFDDTATGTTAITLATNVAPGGITVSNLALTYTFSGTNVIGGLGRFAKDGAGTVIVGISNSYGSDTLINEGTFQLGTNNVIPDGAGKGNVLANGRLDVAGFNDTINGLSGSGALDNSAVGVINTLTVGGNGASGTFAGIITNSGGSLALKKTSTGTLALTSGNSHSGGTTLAGGRLDFSQDSSLGSGPVSLAVPSAGVTLAPFGGTRILTNTFSVTGAGGYPATIDTAGGDLVLAGLVSSSGPDLVKTGPGNWRIASPAGVASSSLILLYQGALILDATSWTNEDDAIRLYANGADVVRLAITNHASLTIGTVGGNMNIRLGYNAGLTGTNQLDLSSGQLLLDRSFNQIYVGDAANTFGVVNHTGGIVKYQNTTNSNAGLLIGSSTGSIGIYNFDGGVLEVPRIRRLSGVGYFNWNGGTLRPSSAVNASSFFTSLTAAYVKDAGAIFDTDGYNITIGQPLLSGGTGGLIKLGTGTLILTGTNTYTGATIVSNGTFVCSTALGGPVAVRAAATLALGAAIGTLPIPDSLSLEGTVALKISRTSAPTNDQIAGLSSVTYGGTLIVTSLGGTPAAGDSFQLFTASSYGGAFASYNLPALGLGLGWDTSSLTVDGTIRVVAFPVVSGTVALEAFVGSSRAVTFSATDGATFTNHWNETLSFSQGEAGYALTVLPGTVRVSARTAWNLRKTAVVDVSGGFAPANFTGGSQLPAGDLDGSNAVDLVDYNLLAAAWYTSNSVVDFDGSGLVDIDDYFLLTNHWIESGADE